MIFQTCCTIQNSENNKSLCSLSLSLTENLGPFVSDTERAHGGAASSGQPNAPVVRFRRGGLHQHDLHHPANLSQPSEQQQAHQRKLHAGHGGHGHGGETLSDDWAPTGKMIEHTSNRMTLGS